MCVSAIVSAHGEAARRSVGRLGGSDLACIVLDIGGDPETTVGKNRQHRDRAAEVVGDQHEPLRRMDTHERGTGAAGPHTVEQL